LLQSAVSNTDLKVNNAQRDAEARLLDSNLALFEARNKLMELEPRYQDAVVLAEKLEARALVWEEEKTKSEMNWQIRLDEMEDNLTEAKDEAEQAVRKVQAQAEKDLQVAVERAAKAESDAFEARRLATAGQSEISLVANQAQLELNEMLRRNELLGEEVTQKTIAMERATQEAARVMQQLDDVTSTLSLVRSQLQDSNRSLAEKNAALDSAKLEIERLSNTIATAESQRTECEIRARDALQTLQQSSAEQILMLDERLRGESEVIAALKTELMVTRKEAQTAQQLAQVLICLFCCLK
jgi:chromosome segregation ATPase